MKKEKLELAIYWNRKINILLGIKEKLNFPFLNYCKICMPKLLKIGFFKGIGGAEVYVNKETHDKIQSILIEYVEKELNEAKTEFEKL